MAEEQRGSRGKSYGNHKSYGSGRPGNRGGKGFKPRGNGGKSYGHKSGGFHNDDRKGGYRKGNGGGYRRGDRDFHRAGESEGQERRFHNGPRKFNRDGERRDDRRGGYRGNRGDNPRYQRDGERSGFRHDDRRDGERRNFRHDGDRRDFRRDDGERRGGRNFHKDGDRRDFRRDDRRGERRDGERRNFRRDDRRDGDRRDFRRDNQRRDFHKDRDQRPEGEERREFTREDFVVTVRDTLARTGFPPAFLELEITESTLQVIEQSVEILGALKAIGISISIDDFGTGYSSLSYLKSLPLDKIKIDKSFVQDLLEDEDDATIVRAIIQLGKTLQLQVIAEGVETVEHGRLLMLLGCDLAQGYGIARPMPAEDFMAFLATRLVA